MKIFNVSHHKCGTSSMQEAFKILGFKSYHWGTCMDWWEPYLRGKAMDPRLGEDNTAFGDLPIPMMYRELYRLYPDAKYVFVKRDPVQWLVSLKKHLKRGWLEPHPVHTMFYGYPLTAYNVDDTVCLRAYGRFESDILDFFCDKQNFLYLKLESLDWEPLCSFLGKEVPKQAFPQLHKSP